MVQVAENPRKPEVQRVVALRKPQEPDVRPRCSGCGKLLAEMLTRPWRIRCRHNTCRTMNERC